MDARKIVLDSIREATAAIEGLGSNNSRLMASRAVHINVSGPTSARSGSPVSQNRL